jgi:excisionase family DNA binding protein
MSTKQDPFDDFYSVEFVARKLGVSPKSIRRWIEAGELHFHKFHGVLRISEEDLKAFISTRRK